MLRLVKAFRSSPVFIKQPVRRTADTENTMTCSGVKILDSLVRGRAVEARLGHIRHVGVTAVAVVIEKVVPVTFGVTDAVPLLVVGTAAPVARLAVTCIEPGERVVAFRVAGVVTDLVDVAVGQDQPVSEGGVGHIVNAELPRNVIWGEGIVQLLVLQADLVVAHCRPQPRVVPDIHHAVAHLLGPTEGPEVVVVLDDLHVVAESLATGRWLKRCVQYSFRIPGYAASLECRSPASSMFWLRKVTILHGQPLPPRVLKRFADD